MAKGKSDICAAGVDSLRVFCVVPMIFFARNFWPRPALPYREGGGVSQQPFSSRQPFLCPVCPPLQRVRYAVGIVPPVAPCSLSHVSFQRNSLLLSPSDKQALNPPQARPFPRVSPAIGIEPYDACRALSLRVAASPPLFFHSAAAAPKMRGAPQALRPVVPTPLQPRPLRGVQWTPEPVSPPSKLFYVVFFSFLLRASYLFFKLTQSLSQAIYIADYHKP